MLSLAWSYLAHIGGRHLAGVKANAPISDHAVLRFSTRAPGG